IAAGFVVACRSIEQGGEFELEHLFAGFRIRFGNLVVVGLLFLAGSVAIVLVFAAFLGFTILGAVLTGDSQQIAATVMKSFFGLALGGLVALALWVPLVAAFWFAPALVVLNDVRPVEAMKQSFVASFRNFVPFLVYGIVMLVFAVLAAIPLGLGLLVWMPLAIASSYAAYRAIFTEDASPAAPATLA
ncbi:MAG TPA: BPSS1780 family membrane protein, partial [Usitatibacter sp.]|nr:BPSS1780 family membrane protein [Usitatibacter sp.]